MSQKAMELTACCGIYCPDCIHYRNKQSKMAGELRDELKKVGFDEYAAVKSPFGKELDHYPDFIKVLEAIAGYYCEQTCRVQGGCFSGPCKIMTCCREKGFAGCWECAELEACDQFDFLEPRCGDMPKNNIRKIKEKGLENWIPHRQKYYKWL